MNFLIKLLLKLGLVKEEYKHPNQLIGKFLQELKKGRVQLEIIHKGQLLLLAESLEYVPSWFLITNKNREEFKGGYVLSCVYAAEYFETSYASRALKNIEIGKEYVLLDDILDERPVKSIAHFLPKITEPLDLALAIKDFIILFNSFEESNPMIDFNLRYLDRIPG